jgi:hypothetical protein
MIIEVLIALVLVGGLFVLLPKVMLKILAVLGAVLVGGILLAFGWLGTGDEHNW